jgi:hypothetical protein
MNCHETFMAVHLMTLMNRGKIIKPKKSHYIQVEGTIVQGHQVASGLAENSPFPLGTIEMQLPFFKKNGVNLDDIYPATINVSIAPNTFKLIAPKVTMKNIKWSLDHDAETFSLSPCFLSVNNTEYPAYIYYPHPETKIGHFKNDSLLEILSQHIPDVPYGTQLRLRLNQAEIIVSE